MAALTLDAIRDRVRELVDDNNDILMTDAAMMAEINASGRLLHSIVLQEMPHLLEFTATITPTGDPNFALGNLHYKTLGIRYVDDQGESIPLKPLQYQERHLYQESGTDTRALGYYFKEEELYLVPTPALGTNTYRHDMIMPWTDFTAGSDTMMALDNDRPMSQWAEWIVFDVAAKCQMKAREDHIPFVQMRDEIQAMLLATRHARDVNAQRVLDVRTRHRRGGRHGDPDFWSNR
jgi:hypothetical protein